MSEDSKQLSVAELLARKGLYYAMWRQQIGERKPLPIPEDVLPEDGLEEEMA